jgi:pimeloyl-ACP methyl ester carboxylesterase
VQTVPVTVSDTDPVRYLLSGELCLVDSERGRRSVEILVSGLTYDHHYFDFPYRPDEYSYVRAAHRRGYSTFNIDRLGVGRSDRPPAEKLTVQSHAWTLGQLVRGLRTGDIGGHAFGTVVGVGHSLGAAILQYLAGSANGRDGVPDYLVLSDMLMRGNAAAGTALGKATYPAEEDAKFAGTGLPSGYLTTRPGTRGASFYHPLTADPAAIGTDEALKQPASPTERATLGAARTPVVTRAIAVPVLIVVGEYDTLQCDIAAGLSCASDAAVLARESANFAPGACLAARVVAGAGHSVNLHPTAKDAYRMVHDWLDGYTPAVSAVSVANDPNGCVTARTAS